MADKQPITVNFSKGMETKVDPFQLQFGSFLNLTNIVFLKGGMLTKRNGFGQLSTLPDTTSTYLTTFNGNLTAIGTQLEAFNAASESWINKGAIQPVRLDTLSLIKSNTNQSQADTAIASNGLICTVFTDNTGSATTIKYAIANSVTGQNIVAPQVIPTSSGTPTGSARVYVLGSYFIILFTNLITATSHLQYIAINVNNPTSVVANTNIATYVPASTLSWDAYVANENLYIAYNTTTGGQAIKVTYLTNTLTLVLPVTYAGSIATMVSVTADITTPSAPIIYVSFYDLASHLGKALVVDSHLNPITAPTTIIPSGTILNITSSAQNGVATIIYETANNYGYDSSIPSHFVSSITFTQSGTVGSPSVTVRSVGLASKSFIISGVQYFLGVYVSPYQPTYFLFNSSGNIIAKLAYGNGPGYYTLGLPNVNINESVASFSYLFKDLIQAVNKNTNVPSGSQVNGIYSQTGVNLVSVTITTSNIVTAETGSNLNITGGIMWAYDGYLPVEQGFNLWPDSIKVTTSTTGGFIEDQTNYYQVTYEWSDNQGNLFRSAPSIPVTITTTGGNTSTNTINVPTLRLTYKTANPVKLVVYRWSNLQQIYYQITSITSPILNDPTVDYIAITDTFSNATILGNNILYTTGGVVENIGPPASIDTFIFDDRLWLIDAEDQNLLWFSKQILQSTPVEMSDLLTLYVAPSIGAQGNTGPLTCGAPMDDKAILFKKNAIYYINGTGPDNTGSNSQYSQPIFVTGTVGCSNPNSIVLIPSGLMFQSDKGIWLLGRDLSTEYIGAPMEQYNSALVESALTIPGTNEVRFTLNNGVTIFYDYYEKQWGTFSGIGGISSTLYKGLHTFLDQYGRVFQETPGKYLDGSNPVLISFITGWINPAGIRGYQRIYEFFFLGTYLSPHKLQVQVAYNYGNPVQSDIYSPNNYGGNWGSGEFWGSGSFGGPSNIEQFRVHTKNQLCKSFQIQVQELFDPSFGTIAGAGLTLSAITFVIAQKKGWFPTPAAQSIG